MGGIAGSLKNAKLKQYGEWCIAKGTGARSRGECWR